MWLDLALMHRATLRDMVISSINCIIYSFLVDYAEEMKITASTCQFLSYNCVGEQLSNTRNSWRQLKARGPIWGPTGPFLCSQHSKLKITQPFVACPALQAPIQESHDHLMTPKCHSRLSISGEIVSLMLCAWKLGNIYASGKTANRAVTMLWINYSDIAVMLAEKMEIHQKNLLRVEK